MRKYVRIPGKLIPRVLHLTDDEILVLRQRLKQGDRLPNPHPKGFFHWAIEALKLLGLNRRHPFGAFKSMVQELMSRDETKRADGTTGWQRFCDTAEERQPRISIDQHLRENIEVLQRVNTRNTIALYGLKLLQVGQKVLGTKGCVIHIFAENGELFIELNTNSDIPLNPNRKWG